jgi:hypothetical protein
MSVDPLNLFIQQHGRLPKLGDQPAPYTYRGWLLRYVALAHAVIPTMKDRWGYHQSIMRTAQIPTTPIPYIQFTSAHQQH